MRERLWQIRAVRWFLVFTVAVTAGCVPTARLRPRAESTLNSPPPPNPARNAVGLLSQQPATNVVGAEPKPGPKEQTVEGAYRWAGNEYRYIPAHNEKAAPAYVWKRP